MITIGVRQGRGDPLVDVVALQAAVQACSAAWGVDPPLVMRYSSRKPKGAWRVSFSHRMPAGAAGYHDVRAGVPFALCDPAAGAEVVWHEVLEMVVDPKGSRFIKGPTFDRMRQVWYLVEVCDPVERELGAWVAPGFYEAPYVQPGGYLSWVDGGAWYQAFADAEGNVTQRFLGRASARTAREKDHLATERDAIDGRQS